MSKGINKWHGLGNLTRDPETKFLPSGVGVTTFSVACNDKFKGKDGEWVEATTFVTVKAWARLSEIASEYLRKGSQVYVEGPLKVDSWEDKQTGKKSFMTFVNATDIVLLGGAPSSKRTEEPEAQPNTHGVVIDDSEIPF